MPATTAARIARAGAIIAPLLVDVADFPTAGVRFQDLTRALADAAALAALVDGIAAVGSECGGVDLVAGVESRGFLVGAPAAVQLGAGVVLVRKAGKLPRAVHELSYDLEYGSATLAVHTDAVPAGARVLLVDDVLATGGTAAAARALVERAGGVVVGVAVVLEIVALAGRDRLGTLPVRALLQR